jgi:hypothetical protein
MPKSLRDNLYEIESPQEFYFTALKNGHDTSSSTSWASHANEPYFETVGQYGSTAEDSNADELVQGKVGRRWVEVARHSAFTIPGRKTQSTESARSFTFSKLTRMSGYMFHLSAVSDAKHTFNEKAIGQRPKSRCVCCCIPTRTCPSIVCLLFALLLLGLCVGLGYMYFPRTPEMRVLAIDPVAGIKSFVLTGLEHGLTRNFTVQMDMQMTISVINTNRYDVYVDSIDMNAMVQANISQINTGPGASAVVGGTGIKRVFTSNDASVPIGSGTHLGLTFPAGKNVTFKMGLSVVYTPDQSVQLRDDVMLNEIFQVCNVVEPGNRTMTVHYTATAPVELLKPIGVVPTFDNVLSINCPFSSEALTTLIRQLRITTKV